MEHYKNLNLESIDGEIWKDIVGYEGIYKVSNLGRIMSLKRKYRPVNLIVKQIVNNGYLTVTFRKNYKKRTMLLHRLIAEAFIPNPKNKPFINHKNAIRHDNSIGNLEWCTHVENIQHAHINGLVRYNVGESHQCTALTNNDVLAIKRIYKNGGISYLKISKMYNVSMAYIGNIITNKTPQSIVVDKIFNDSPNGA